MTASLRRRRAFLVALRVAVALAVIVVPLVAAARPGGGSSYSGGGSRSSGGGGGYHGGGGGGGGGGGSGGGGDLLAIFELIVLCVEHPLLGLFVLAVLAVIYISHLVQGGARRDWSTSRAASYDDSPPPPPPISPRKQLEGIRRFDDAFSVVLFEDFLSALYAQVHTARGTGKLDSLSAYLAPHALHALERGDVTEVKAIIVGAMRFTRVSASSEQDPMVQVAVEIESNYTEVSGAGREQAWYVVEQWVLARRASARSRTPDKARVIACPSCGAPLEGVMSARCKYCGKDVCTGAFDWIVSSLSAERQPRGPMLTAQAAEVGTDEPTVADPDAGARLSALQQRDPAFAWQAFQARVGLVFDEFQRAWSARDLAAMRPFLSDNLYEVQTYWVRAYLAQHLRNVTEGARITQLALARVTSDRFFDAVTVRLFATSLDYTVADADGRIVCGSRSRPRAYSEYWTFLRSTRATGAARTDRACPNCGAPLAINMAGHCTHCSAKVTGGDFDWVLSRIEQDESYSG